MRRVKQLPRILDVKNVEGMIIHAVFNNGETRAIDFQQIFDEIGIDRHSPAYILRKPSALKRFKIENNTLSWRNAAQEIVFGGKKKKVPYEIGADVLYRKSTPIAQHNISVGAIIRKARMEAHLTQGDLAKRSGTTAGYISRIENDKSGIEIHTLEKIVEIGLRKKLSVTVS